MCNKGRGDTISAFKYILGDSRSGKIVIMGHLLSGFNKIRAFEAFDGRNLKTFWYEENGLKHPSSKVHTPESVLGIVRYRG